MPRPLLLSTTIVAAFQLHSAAAATLVTDAPISPAVATVAQRVEITPAADRGRFIVDIVPLLYLNSDSRIEPDLFREPPARAGVTSGVPVPVTVPVALTPEIWSRAVFRRTVALPELLTAILRDPRAAYLARGLAGVDDDTLTYLAEHPEVLRFLYERGTGVFAGFSDVLRVQNGRVVVPYGAEAARLWESVIGEPLSAPDRVIRVLFSEHNGRLAYLMSVIAAASPSQARFALGLWMDDPRQTDERFKALAAACIGAYGEWHIEERPFSRPMADLATLLLRFHAAANGAPGAPAARAFWRQVFGDIDLFRSSSLPSIDAAWLVESTGGLDMYARTERIEQFAFAQRVFPDALNGAEPLPAIVKSFPTRRMLLLSLERMNLRAPAVYQSALAAADAVAEIGTGHRFWALAQYQGALALLVRMYRVGTIDTARAEALVTSLSAVRAVDGDYGAPTAKWMREALAAALPPGDGWETRIIAAISGPADAARTPRVSWEGQWYRFDAAAAERRRIEAVRRRQGGHTVDLAMTIDAVSASLRHDRPTLESVRAAEATLDAMVVDAAARLRRPPVNLLPPAVSAPRDALQWLNAIRADLHRIDRPGDTRNAPRVGASLQPLIDIMLGNALASINYAAEIGSPEGAALLAGNVALRHDFGLGRRQADIQVRQAWALPRQDFLPGVPWHVSGSMLGLDVAMASLQIRRLSIDRVPDAPKLTSVEREEMAVGVAMLNPHLQTNDDLVAIAEAIGRGRTMVRAAAVGQGQVAVLIERLGLDGWRARALRWSAEHEPSRLLSQLTLADLLTIDGGVASEVLDRWGVSGIHGQACVCSRFFGSHEARVLEGRYQLPIVAATMGDLTLAVAVMLHDLHLPAVLARPVMMVGLPDFIDAVPRVNAGVWWGVAREAQTIRRERIEDYVSAAAAVDGPLVPEDPDSSNED